MKLTKLRIAGFKTFVEPADFLIEAGLTGVVGPNGCGKSNLVEALRWVMGESSHKSLRAADMDDVIFSGTNNRPGRNNAEVAIQIDNNARKAPAQFNEHATLDVSRRIERDAGSTYRINGREVRARDVQILFADASTGSRSPSMVHQGRIGEIIQAKPEQRRRVLEEAAGISGLHARRHEAELRLRAAEHNLARLEDVINQLAGQIDALKRQARQAIRYRAVAERVRKAEATLFHLRWVAANAELAEAEQAKSAAVRLVAPRNGAQADAVLARSEKGADELTATLADLTARRHALEHAAREHDDRAARLAGEIAAVEAALEQVEAKGRADLAPLAKAAESTQTAVAEAEAAALRAEAAHSAARQALDVARGPLAEAERRGQRLDTEAKTLAKLLHVDAKKLWPPALDRVAVDKGYEAALGAALGDDLEAPIDPSAPMRWAGAAIDAADPALPDGVHALGDHVKAPKELARRLAQIGVIKREEAARLAPMLKPGQRLVSREGDLWRWDGFAVAADAPAGAARRLAGKNRLAEIEAELTAARREVEDKQKAVTAAEAEVASAAEAEAAARTHWRALQHESQVARERHAEAERETSRNAARLSALREAAARLTASRDETTAARNEAQRALKALPLAANIETQLAGARGEIEGQRARLAEVRAEAQALAREAELSARRLAAIAADRQAWSARNDGAAAQITTLDARVEEAKTERASLADAPRTFEQKRRALIGEIEAAQAERRAAAAQLAEGENALAEADRAARAALEAMGTAREEAARAEERFEGGKRRLGDVAHEIREMLEIEPTEVAKLAGIDPGKALPDVAEVEADLEKLRRDRERLGQVNLRAEEELREVETQHGSLTAERDDLQEAIRKLRLGIQSLNREARERLLASFEVVNGHFERLFTSLFGGGTAELQLIESEDPLEAGLDILAKPPGKKPSTLSLLSGGEQALTALALIFAVFLTNPAPICVLDEVDAPLDDHNVDRFCDLLDEMTRLTDTRFVIITHNPITMARMNRLFGVTMAERGVSQLVSVDLETAARIREAV